MSRALEVAPSDDGASLRSLDPQPVDATAIDHMIDCVAGFHLTESNARDASARLVALHGLLPSQLLLLQPADATWLRFLRQRRRWALSPDAEGQTWRSDRWLMTGSGGMLAALIAALAMLIDGRPGFGLGNGWAIMIHAVAIVLGMLAGYAWAATAGQSPQHRRFNTTLRGQLANGRWVVLAHDLPWERQAAVVKMLRDHSQDWCAVAMARRWL